ncbi:hypothetical protein MGN70_009405 [Eutypa lata]|nr:hypothetical protein MGN70_009405 [Eutypa lata]
MVFGSNNPTIGTSATLKTTWELPHAQRVPQQLAEAWIAQSRNGKGPLDQNRYEQIAEILELNGDELQQELLESFRMPKPKFVQFKYRILSLLIAWEQILLEKTRFDESGLDLNNPSPESLSPHECLILLTTISNVVRPGIATFDSPPKKRTFSNDVAIPTIEVEEPESSNKKVKIEEDEERKLSSIEQWEGRKHELEDPSGASEKRRRV